MISGNVFVPQFKNWLYLVYFLSNLFSVQNHLLSFLLGTCVARIMEDWQNISFEEKVEVKNIVLFPSDMHLKSEIKEFKNGIKEEQSDYLAHNDIKTEKIELIERNRDANAFEFSRNENFTCQICALEFGNKVVLNIHNSFMHPEETKEDQIPNLGMKNESVHGKIKQPQCKASDYETRQKDNLNTTIESGNKGIKKFKCNLCDCKTTRKSNLKKHIESVHEGIKPFKCNICDFKTGHKPSLKKHIESIHEQIKQFKCNICDFETGHKPSLKKHIESIHEQIKQFKCNICDFETGHKQSLKRHIESIHEQIKPFKCKICDYKASHKHHIKKHIESVHEGLQSYTKTQYEETHKLCS